MLPQHAADAILKNCQNKAGLDAAVRNTRDIGAMAKPASEDILWRRYSRKGATAAEAATIARTTDSPELLRKILAKDKRVTVRRAAALNRSLAETEFETLMSEARTDWEMRNNLSEASSPTRKVRLVREGVSPAMLDSIVLSMWRELRLEEFTKLEYVLESLAAADASEVARFAITRGNAEQYSIADWEQVETYVLPRESRTGRVGENELDAAQIKTGQIKNKILAAETGYELLEIVEKSGESKTVEDVFQHRGEDKNVLDQATIIALIKKVPVALRGRGFGHLGEGLVTFDKELVDAVDNIHALRGLASRCAIEYSGIEALLGDRNGMLVAAGLLGRAENPEWTVQALTKCPDLALEIIMTEELLFDLHKSSLDRTIFWKAYQYAIRNRVRRSTALEDLLVREGPPSVLNQTALNREKMAVITKRSDYPELLLSMAAHFLSGYYRWEKEDRRAMYRNVQPRSVGDVIGSAYNGPDTDDLDDWYAHADEEVKAAFAETAKSRSQRQLLGPTDFPAWAVKNLPLPWGDVRNDDYINAMLTLVGEAFQQDGELCETFFGLYPEWNGKLPDLVEGVKAVHGVA